MQAGRSFEECPSMRNVLRHGNDAMQQRKHGAGVGGDSADAGGTLPAGEEVGASGMGKVYRATDCR